MSNLRELARGRECQVRLPSICNFNPETTVLAHYRLAGTCGTGIKPPDFLGAHCCSSCHAACDGATRTDFTHGELRLALAEGVFRTQMLAIKLGKLK